MFGDSVNFFSIQEKYKFLVASIKEIIIPDVISRDFVTDEVVDYTINNQKNKDEWILFIYAYLYFIKIK